MFEIKIRRNGEIRAMDQQLLETVELRSNEWFKEKFPIEEQHLKKHP